jgi:hypothetical protein
VVAVGQELLAVAAVFDADDAGFGELVHRPVDGVDRAAQAPGQGLPGWHPGAGAVAVAKQQGVEAERAVGEGCVDHPFGDDREPRFLHDEGPGGGQRGVRRWGFSGHGDGLSSGCAEVGKADSTAAPQGVGASGIRQEMHRNCGRSPAVAGPVYVTTEWPLGVPSLGDVVVARAAGRDRGSASA